MKLSVKIVLGGLLALLAAACLVSTLFTLGVLGARAQEEQSGYLLRETDGGVYIFQLPDTRSPVSETDIETDSLPAADRAELREGIRAADWSELIQRLEDLGS